MPFITKVAEHLDWPDDDEGEVATVECVGQGFLEFYGLWKATGGNEETVWAQELGKDQTPLSQSKDESNEDGKEDDTASFPPVDLFSLSELELEEIDYYKVLHLPCRPTITPDDVKKAYRKSCLKYHPDKSGRGEEDAVFLKVKAAFETLSTQKKAYDSTEMPFDESIPSDEEITESDFFQLFQPVFNRNLHFDSRFLPSSKNNAGNKRNNRRNNGKNKNKNTQGPPSLGNLDTPIEEVHEYYDYWINFESWRDFGLQAARELETQDHLDNAESRYEKRWFQKEIDRAAKKLKQQEVARITLLVEKAMASDPRLIQEKKRLIEEKERKQQQRKQEALEKKQKEEEAKIAEQQKVEEEKRRKAEEKMAREQEKKKLRKAKQAFKKCVGAALEELEEKEYALEDEVDIICAQLDLLKLTKMNSNLEAKSASEVVAIVKKRSENLKNRNEDPGNGSSVGGSHSSNQPQTVTITSTKKKKTPFSKEEMTALAKGVKKFPHGGANRWDLISNYVNNVCRPDNPRTKEECIETFNKSAKSTLRTC
jgi:DnaJ family protein C protein 2